MNPDDDLAFVFMVRIISVSLFLALMGLLVVVGVLP